MTQPGYGSGDERLTPAERERLRPTVDTAVLERWLEATRGQLRRAVIAHFASHVTDDDVVEVLREAGEPLATIVDRPVFVDGDAASSAGAHERHRQSGGLDFRFIPSWQPVVIITPPEDPSLRALWSSIEPQIPLV
jgi:hypothetical protein